MTTKRPSPITLCLLAAGLLTAGLFAAVATSVPVVAHHAFGAEFDPNRPVLLRGPIVRVEWVNPHTWIHLEVTNEDGTREVWMVEGGTPNTLLRRGPAPGLRAAGYGGGRRRVPEQGPDGAGPMRGDLTFEDGRKFFMGSSGTGAPYDNERRDR